MNNTPTNTSTTTTTAHEENTFSIDYNSDLSIPQSAMSQDSCSSDLLNDQLDLFTSVFTGISVPLTMNSSTMASTTVPTPQMSTSTVSNGWQNCPSTGTMWTTGTTSTLGNPTLEVNGNMRTNGSITLKDGSDLEQRLQAIEKRLGIMRRNAEFEEVSEELKELAERYQTIADGIQRRVDTWKKLASD